MNRKVLSQFFGLLILVALLMQSVHSVHHLEESFSEKKCLHESSGNQAEIIHGHHDLEHCFVCEFTFSNATQTQLFFFKHHKVAELTSYTYFHSKEITQFFKGSLFALRAPPTFIV